MDYKPVKYRLGKYRFEINLAISDNKMWFKYNYNAKLKDDMKSRFDVRWHPERKLWYGPLSEHNLFQLRVVTERKPYAKWDKPQEQIELPQLFKKRLDAVGVTPYAHQMDMFRECVTRQQKILAAEPGTGKTLVFFALMYWCMEQGDKRHWVYVGPRSAINSVKVQMVQWNLEIDPKITTYDSLEKMLSSWDGPAPHVFFDECSRLKNPQTKRSTAAAYLAENCRKEGCFIIEASGTPAPKQPTDWWSQANIAQPGFLRESNIGKLRKNMCFLEQQENQQTGGVYNKILRWRDTDTYCDTCGLEEEDCNTQGCRNYKPGKNEVTRLHDRLKGLVSVYLKKDCIDLPERTFETRQCDVPHELLQTARTIARTSRGAAQALIALRQLSDGFRYSEEKSGNTKKCTLCEGSGEFKQLIYVGPVTDTPMDPLEHPEYYESAMHTCPECSGTGEVPTFIRTVKDVASPKDQIVLDLLEEDDDLGRIIFYAGFQGSIDHVVDLVQKQGWHYIKVDGRSYHSSFSDDPVEMLIRFQDPKEEKKIAFVGNPASAGMGLNLTAARTMAFYSNSFNYEDRAQGLERNFRIGQTKAVRVVDIFNLPTDEYVYENLKKKKRLQQMTMGEVLGALE